MANMKSGWRLPSRSLFCRVQSTCGLVSIVSPKHHGGPREHGASGDPPFPSPALKGLLCSPVRQVHEVQPSGGRYRSRARLERATQVGLDLVRDPRGRHRLLLP